MSQVLETIVGRYEIFLRDEGNHLLPATIELGYKSWTEPTRWHTECQVRLQWAGGVLEDMGWHFVAAFKRIRAQLAVDSLLPVCYGASRKIIITGMAMDMGLGRRVYRVGEDGQLKRPPVDIFITGDDVEPVSVAAQGQFQDEWLKALRQS